MNTKKLISMLAVGLMFVASVCAQISITHGPYLQAVGEHEVTIVWTTDKQAVSWVELAPSGDDSFYSEERPRYYQTKDGNRVTGTLHKVRITGLSRGTEYRYRIFSQEVSLSERQDCVIYSYVTSSDVYGRKPFRFTTLDTTKPAVACMIVNDIHRHKATLAALCGGVRYGATDFVFFNGDMDNFMKDEASFFGGFMDTAVYMFASETPVFYVRGNHETRGPISTAFADYFPSSSGKPYYAFKQGPLFVIALDSGEDKPDSDIEYFGLAQFDAYRSEQREWLQRQVQSEAFRDAAFRIAIIHIPPVGDEWHGAKDIREKLLPILSNAGITAMFCGHLHHWQYFAPDAKRDFPVFINDNNTLIEIKADNDALSVKHKDTAGKTLHEYSFNKK